MSPRTGSVQRPWPKALLWAGGAALAYTGLLVGPDLLPPSAADVTASLLWTVGVSLLVSLGIIGVPVALWRRYGLRAPVALVAFLLLFWHVLL